MWAVIYIEIFILEIDRWIESRNKIMAGPARRESHENLRAHDEMLKSNVCKTTKPIDGDQIKNNLCCTREAETNGIIF